MMKKVEPRMLPPRLQTTFVAALVEKWADLTVETVAEQFYRSGGSTHVIVRNAHGGSWIIATCLDSDAAELVREAVSTYIIGVVERNAEVSS